MERFEGTAVRIDIGVGHWGLECADGTRILLMASPSKFSLLQEGKQIVVEGSKMEMYGTAMWGDFPFEVTGCHLAE